jgi:hypothetical protein
MLCVEITHLALGHPEFHRMWNTIRKSYYWKSMQHDVRLYCSTCHYCCSRKSSSEKGSIPIAGYIYQKDHGNDVILIVWLAYQFRMKVNIQLY